MMGGSVGKRVVTRKLYRQIVILFVLGSIVGLDCDQIHVQFAVLRYSNPEFLGQPWWVGPQYGLAAVIACIVAWVSIPATTAVRFGKQLLRFSLWFFGAYLATGLLADRPELLACLLFASWICRMISLCRDWMVIVFSFALAIVGTLYEVLLTTGPKTFAYLGAQVLGVPIWLPGLYLHAGPFVVGLSGIFAIREMADDEPAGRS
jgi:hypothetical protein